MQTSILSTSKCEVYTIETFPFDILRYVVQARNANGRPRAHAKKYADIIATFDIESTNFPEQKIAVMWHWQACIDGFVCVGRTWNEYEKFLKGVDDNLPQGLCFVQYVHNLAYE